MNELKVNFMSFCDYAMVSQENKFSIIGMFDELRVSQLPGGLASAFLVAIVKGKPETTYAISVQGNKGEKTVFPPITLDVRTGAGGVSNITINLTNMGFPEEGEYLFTITYEKKEIGVTKLKVINVAKKTEEEPPLTYKLPN